MGSRSWMQGFPARSLTVQECGKDKGKIVELDQVASAAGGAQAEVPS